MDQRADHQQLLLHALGVGAHLVVDRVLQGENVQVLLNMRLTLGCAHLIYVRHKVQVLHAGQPVIQVVSVGHKTDQALGFQPFQVHPVPGHRHGSPVRRQDTGHQLDGGGLAGAVRSDKSEQFAAVHRQRQVIHRLGVVFCVGFRDMFQCNHGLSSFLTYCRWQFSLLTLRIVSQYCREKNSFIAQNNRSYFANRTHAGSSFLRGP